MSSYHEPKCSLCTRVGKLHKIVHPGRKREKIRATKAFTRHTGMHVSDTEEISLRTRRLDALHEQLKDIVEKHAKCGACEILFGPGHTFGVYASGLCQWCYNRRRQ